MKQITVQQTPPAPGDDADRRELLERIERLQRRIANMAEAAQRADGELRRQRASGRRP